MRWGPRSLCPRTSPMPSDSPGHLWRRSGRLAPSGGKRSVRGEGATPLLPFPADTGGYYSPPLASPQPYTRISFSLHANLFPQLRGSHTPIDPHDSTQARLAEGSSFFLPAGGWILRGRAGGGRSSRQPYLGLRPVKCSLTRLGRFGGWVGGVAPSSITPPPRLPFPASAPTPTAVAAAVCRTD